MLVIDGKAIIDIPFSDNAAPLKKSNWPVTPLYYNGLLEFAQNCPKISILIALFIAVNFGFARMFLMSLTKAVS